MDAKTFYERWQEKSGVYLLESRRRSFIKDCRQILYLGPEYLEAALDAASRTGTFDLRYMEAVALNIRHSKHAEGKVIDFLKARRRLANRS